MRPILASILLSLVSAACSRGDTNAPSGATTASADKSLEQLISCNDAAIGGDLLRAASRVDYDLELTEPNFEATGHYYATRDGDMRIDVYIKGARVYSEGRDATSAWEQAQDPATPAPASEDGAAALRHGIEQPGHLWTLADMPRNGHAVALEDRETIDGISYYVVKLTMKDGFENWYWLDPQTCHIARSRNFRAYHPDVDPDRRWTESRFESYEDFDGIRKARVTRDVDIATGKTIGQTRISSYKATFEG
jgi:hypothetical protein